MLSINSPRVATSYGQYLFTPSFIATNVAAARYTNSFVHGGIIGFVARIGKMSIGIPILGVAPAVGTWQYYQR